MIVAVLGLPGSGKSYFASKLAKKVRARYVSSDVIRQRLIAVRKYSLDEKMIVYNEMINEMKTTIRKDENIVLDATFYKKDVRNKFIDAAWEFDQSILFIEVLANPEIIKERLSRKRPYSEAGYSVYLKLKEVFEPLERDHLVLCSTQENIDEMLSEALKYIQQNNGKRTGQ